MPNPTPRPVKFACVQFEPTHPAEGVDNVAANIKKAIQYIEKAKKEEANVVVFPEYFLAGIVADHQHLAQREHLPLGVIEESGEWLEMFKKEAIKHDIDIALGTIVELCQEDGNLYNVANYINRKGELIGRYRKRHLWDSEKDYLSPGREDHVVFDTEYGRVGLMICWDMAWPEATRSCLRQKADVIICPTYWTSVDGSPRGLAYNPECETLFIDSVMITRAFENECCFVMTNCGGPAEAGFIGRTGVTVPFKGMLKQAVGSTEQMIIVDVDLGILEDAKTVYAIGEDLNIRTNAHMD